MLERFTRKARAVVAGAQAVAAKSRAAEVRPVHLLEALVAAEDDLAMTVLVDLGAPREEIRQVVQGLASNATEGLDTEDAEALRLLGIDLDEVMSRIDRDLGGDLAPIGGGRRRFGTEAKKTLELSLREAVRLQDGFIGSEHLLLGLLRLGDRTTLDVLAAFDLNAADVRAAIESTDRRAG